MMAVCSRFRLEYSSRAFDVYATEWLIVTSQNDNSDPGLPPEFEGITTPLPIPNQVNP
jgi:hypothetical protein